MQHSNNGKKVGGITGKGFMPGQSGNPGGKKKEPEAFKQLAREHSIEALQTVILLLNDKNTRPNEKLKAAELIMDRAWGKATQHIDADLRPDTDSFANRLIDMTDEEIEKLLLQD